MPAADRIGVFGNKPSETAEKAALLRFLKNRFLEAPLPNTACLLFRLPVQAGSCAGSPGGCQFQPKDQKGKHPGG
jgi:hypothetical protein